MAKSALKFSLIITTFWAVGTLVTNANGFTILLNPEFIYDVVSALVLWFIVGLILVWIKNKLFGDKNKSNLKQGNNPENSDSIQPGEKVIHNQVISQESKTKKCPSCSRDNLTDVTFCNYCGYKFIHSCQNCGRENPVDATICGYCGVNLSDTPIKQIKTETTVSSAPISLTKSKVFPEPKSNNDMSIVLMVVAAILAVLLLGGIVLVSLKERAAYLQPTTRPVVKNTLVPTLTPIPAKPTYTEAEKKRRNELNLLQGKLISCARSADGESYILKGTILNAEKDTIRCYSKRQTLRRGWVFIRGQL